ncbi:uncharacterized protein LOC133785697 [Humulus lupulus]|uniref:uncharacterized protein LOC133785697 n=1 Tax=Humulus lupulus TaxID=3486 RepID=UPI002B40CBAC|nr:uncharacterized protein LOC133785697 [Humulus lupulus]
MSFITLYDGGTDPTEHLSKFNRMMSFHRVSEDAKCHVFPLTLMRSADKWFKKHRSGSIHSWHQLSSSFRRQCIAAWKVSFEVNALANIKQGPLETLKAYIKHFKEEEARTKRVDDGQQLMALQAGIQAGSSLWDDLQRRGCHQLDDFIRQPQEYVNWEDAHIGAFRGPVSFPTLSSPKRHGSRSSPAGFGAMPSIDFNAAPTGYGARPTRYKDFQLAFSARTVGQAQFTVPSETSSERRRGGNGKGKMPKWTGATLTGYGVAPKERYTSQYSEYMKLVDSRENIFVVMGWQIHYWKPQPIRRDRERRDSNKFCRSPNDVGHHTNECQKIKDEIENLIKLGHLHQYARGRAGPTQAMVVGVHL